MFNGDLIVGGKLCGDGCRNCWLVCIDVEGCLSLDFCVYVVIFEEWGLFFVELEVIVFFNFVFCYFMVVWVGVVFMGIGYFMFYNM